MTAQLTPFPNLWNPCECREYSFRGIKYAGFASSRGKSPSPEKESKGELLHSQNTNVRFADSFRGAFLEAIVALAVRGGIQLKVQSAQNSVI